MPAVGNQPVGHSHGLALALLVLGLACGGHASPPSPQAEVASDDSQLSSRTITLEDGVYLDIRPGIEDGFTHCCGNAEYVMEMDCSDRLLRCYKRSGDSWKQTFGKHCRNALGEECYLQQCNTICEAIESVGGHH